MLYKYSNTTRKPLLIVPYGIEIFIAMMAYCSIIILLIVPYGIEIMESTILKCATVNF